MKKLLSAPLLFAALLLEGAAFATPAEDPRVALGRALFHDTALSRDGTQSCATCHQAERAFIDPRENATSPAPGVPGAVSLGQDGRALGDFNSPMVSYAALVPAFHYDEKEALFRGGLFFDGRAADLKAQAKMPFTDPVEMQNTVEGVVAAVRARHGAAMRAVYGEDVFDDTERAFDAVADAIAHFERSPEFMPFDSRFDRWLRGELELTAQERRGLELFKAEDKGNCAACHPVPERDSPPQERLFTDFTYDNLGVPANRTVRVLNGKGAEYVEDGLYGNPAVDDPALRGAHRVSSLRNVAVTAPYMHNGVFRDLATVVRFYNSRDVAGALNPETGRPWAPPEVPETVNREELGDLGLDDGEVADIVAFLRTLTDRRYEPLLEAR